MRGDEFITRPMSVWLDLVRALAALAVVFGHAFRLELYTGPFVPSLALEKNAVVIFFVLSGLVIAASVDRRGDSLSSYAIARISRIMPVALGAVVVALGVAALDANLGLAPLFPEHRGWADPVEMLQALLFLSESYNTSFALNPPHWSLCYEVWFYAIFGAASYLDGRRRVIWLILLGAAAGPNALLLLPAWLVGVWLARNPAARDLLPRSKALVYVAVALASLFILPNAAPAMSAVLAAIAPWMIGSSLYAVTDLVLALAVAIGFIGLRALSAGGAVLPAASETPIRFLAGMSFSLYMLHYPLLKLMRILGITAGDSLAGLVAIVVAIVAVSAVFAAATEHTRYAVRAFLEGLLRRSRPALAAS